ncbi:hypothetical protein ACFX2G_014852 [Malus domestica]
MGNLLAQNNEGGKEQAIYYRNRILTEIETRYTSVERLCLALYFTAFKTKALHVALPHPYHYKDRCDQIHAVKTNANWENWKVDFSTISVQLSTYTSQSDQGTSNCKLLG